MSSIPVSILFVITLAALVSSSVTKTLFSRKSSGGFVDYFFFNALVFGSATVLFFAFAGFRFNPSLYTVLLSAAFGIITLLQSLVHLSALSVGPMGYTGLIMSLSCVIPALSGPILWPDKENFDLVNHSIGLVLVIVCCVLSVNKSKNENEKKASLKWFLLCVVASVLTGIIGILQKVHQESPHNGEISEFLICSFLISTVFSFIAFFVCKSKAKTKQIEAQPAKKFGVVTIAVLVAVTGLGVALNNQINLYLSGAVPSIIFFPVVNIGGLVLMLVASFIVFKEKMSLRQWIGVVSGIAAGYFLAIGIPL